jgi:uncharacterized protein YjbI with pentapeptide repeats
MRSLTRLIFGMALAAAAPAASLLVTSYGQEAAAKPGVALNGTSFNGIALNGVALNGVALNGVGLNGVGLNGVALNGASLNGANLNGVVLNGNGLARMSDAAGVADPNRLRLRAIRLPGE